MKFKILFSICIFVFISASGISHAGFLSLTMFSRANCIAFNESVSWDATRQWVMDIESWQFHDDERSRFFYDYHGSWWDGSNPPRNRAYAGCALCGISGWYVVGDHYLLDKEYPDSSALLMENCPVFVPPGWTEEMVLCKVSYAISCNLTEW